MMGPLRGILDAEYDVVERFTAEFAGGNSEDWLSSDVTNGSVSYESNFGGRAVLATGTGSTGDAAALRSDLIGLSSRVDAVCARAVVAHDEPLGAADAWVGVGLDSADNGVGILHIINHSTTSLQKTIYDSNDSSTTDTRPKMPTTPVRSEVCLDQGRTKFTHRYQNIYAADGNTQHSGDVRFVASVKTQDTGADRQLYLYAAELAFLQRRT